MLRNRQMVNLVQTGTMQKTEPGTAELCNSVSSIGGRYIRFGPFQMDLQKEVISKDGYRIKLSGKKYGILLKLLEKPGEVVTRDAICQDFWPRLGEASKNWNLTTTINVLRRVLGDSSLNPLYIETIPAKGYVFIAQPEVSNHPNGFHLTLPMDQASRATAKSRFFSIRCIIGLILIGMVFGSGMMAVWISHHG